MKPIPNNYYVIGKVMGGQRTENLIKYLLDNNNAIYYNAFRNSKGLPPLLFNIYKKLSSVINLFMADVVILPAMCNSYQFEFKLASRFKKKIIVDFYLSLYDTHVLDKKPTSNGVIINSDSPYASKLIKIDRSIIKNSTFTFFLNSSEADYYLNLLNLDFDPKKHFIVPICSSKKPSSELNFYTNRKQVVFNICWWGTYIPLHGLNQIIEAAKILNENYKIDFHLYLLGNSNKKAKPYKDLIRNLNLSKYVTIYNDKTFANGKLIPFLQKHCDLALGNFGNSGKSKHVLGNKIIDGVSMKIPVLTGESIGPHEFFSEVELFYTNNSPEAIAKSIYNISKISNSEIKQRVENAYKIYDKQFSIKAFNNRIESLLQKV